MSFVLQAVGTILVFSLEYYVFPGTWMSDATVNWQTLAMTDPLRESMRAIAYSEAITVAFVQAALFELFVVWNCRSEKRSVWKMGRDALKNKLFVIAEIISISATLGLLLFEPTRQLFHLTVLTPIDFVYVLVIASWGLFVFPEVTMNRSVWKWK